jgi:PhnB protein
MASRPLYEELDRGVEALLAGAAPGSAEAGSELESLLGVAAELRGLPADGFRAELGAELLALAATAGSREGGAMTTEVAGIREGFHTVTPYLTVRGAAQLVDFVKAAFGATGSAGGLHAELRIGDSMLMLGGSPDLSFDEQPGALHLYVPDVDVTYQRALAAGATSVMGPTDQEYGDRDAALRDPFGNLWYVGTHKGPGGPVPAGLRSLTPYLQPRGAADLADFLGRALGAEQLERHQSPEGVLHHAKLRLGDSVVELGEAHGPFAAMPAMLYLYVPDVDALYARALGAGATAMQAPANQPYGDRTAHLKDPAGNSWYLATPIGETPARP